MEGTKKFYDLGNCKETCPHDTFVDFDSIEKCKCSVNISCNNCTKKSIELGLCVTCNTDKGFYPKSDEAQTADGFINCYKNPEGYFLNNLQYESCYLSCKSCGVKGDENDNKCDECKSGYEVKNDPENVNNNCYQICPNSNYYYYDSYKKYQCTEDNNCPTNFNKLIRAKNRCIDECKNDNIYKYENGDECVRECPSGTHTDSINEYKCITDLNCELLEGKYYNYAKNECISEIPPGYYCNDEIKRTIDKCHSNCKTCNQSGDDTNNNCLTCEESLFFNLGNCVLETECTNGVFTEGLINKCKCTTDTRCKLCNEESKSYERCVSCDNENGYYPKSDEPDINSYINCYKNPEGYFLNNLQYEPCYLSCKSCEELGDENYNKCNECKSGYEIKNDPENVNNNCYQICPNYYFYDTDNKYKCTDDNNCPLNFNKLIKEKKKMYR